MSGPPPAGPDGPVTNAAPAGAGDDPLAADRRTMVIAALAMVGLVLVGIASAAVFTRSACRAIAPEVVPGRLAGAEIDEALRLALPDADEDTRADMSEGLTAAAAQLGPLSGIANVSGGTSLAAIDATATDGSAATDEPVSAVVVEGAFAVLGSTTTVLDTTGREVAATASFDDDATIVGDGDTLYSLARSNERTGQVDALLPLDDRLEGLTCVDTATVATPLAFHLDAGDGQLLLYRADEDGDDAVLELRDPVAGRVWAAPIEVGPAPPGVMGERLDGVLGEDLVVLARRTAASDDPDVPVVTAIDRVRGEVVWTVARADLADDTGDVEAGWVEVLGVGDDVVLAVTDDLGEDVRGATRLVVHRAADGAPVGASDAGDDLEVLDAVLDADGRVLVAETDPDGWVVTEARDRLAGGEPRLAGFEELTALAAVDDGRFVALTEGGALIVAPHRTDAVVWPFVGLDVLGHDDRVTLLLAGPDGPGAIAVTFED